MSGIRVRGLFGKFFSLPRSYVQRSRDNFKNILCLRDELVCLSKSYDNIFLSSIICHQLILLSGAGVHASFTIKT